jgi:hypothetical protein
MSFASLVFIGNLLLSAVHRLDRAQNAERRALGSSRCD